MTSITLHKSTLNIIASTDAMSDNELIEVLQNFLADFLKRAENEE